MSVILFYSPFDQRSRDTESLMIAFRQKGHKVISLSQASGAQIHEYLKQHDIETYTHIIPGSKNWLYYLKHAAFLVSFIRKHKVQIVYSHLEPANVAASIAGYFVNGKVYLVRHHIDEAKLQGFNRSWAYRLTYGLAKNIIVVSAQAKKFMVEEENVKAGKIRHINLAYDFNIYGKPDVEKVKEIRSGFEDYTTLLTVCRFTQYKRADVAVQTLRLLRDRGIRARLIMLGRGEEEAKLKAMIRDAGLTDLVAMPGYVNNAIDYMAASDFLVHPSVLESSCVTVKEAALVGLPVIVSKGIGDFDDYLEHGVNGFALGDQFATQAAEIISQYRNTDMSSMTGLLYKRVVELFDIRNVASEYQKLNEA